MIEAGIHNHGIEAGFAVLSLVMVAAGWYLADLMYRQGSTASIGLARCSAACSIERVYNKYYVDEVYDGGPGGRDARGLASRGVVR